MLVTAPSSAVAGGEYNGWECAFGADVGWASIGYEGAATNLSVPDGQLDGEQNEKLDAGQGHPSADERWHRRRDPHERRRL